uniref:Uncharacterized protein n=1 Tax=Rangifer tarandus platyrhynchus TaxID=3082113 RepID=A0ACB0DQR4_RANTA|nr:unnamed protein product [Rangifer tarandus platyrhynchus]
MLPPHEEEGAVVPELRGRCLPGTKPAGDQTEREALMDLHTGIRAGPVAAAPPGGPAPRAASPRHLCTQRRRLPRKYSKFLIKTYDCVNSTGWAPNLEKTFRHPAGRPAARPPHAGSPDLGPPPVPLIPRRTRPGCARCPWGPHAPLPAQRTALTPGSSAGRGLEKSFLPTGVRFGSAK